MKRFLREVGLTILALLWCLFDAKAATEAANACTDSSDFDRRMLDEMGVHSRDT